MAVYCFSAPPQVTNTFPEVFWAFWSSNMSFCSFIAPRHIPLKCSNVTYIGDQEARYCNRRVQFFPEITYLRVKSLTVYLICDSMPEKNIGLHRLTRITISLGNQLTRFRFSYHTKFKVCPPHYIVVDRESLNITMVLIGFYMSPYWSMEIAKHKFTSQSQKFQIFGLTFELNFIGTNLPTYLQSLKFLERIQKSPVANRVFSNTSTIEIQMKNVTTK